MMHARVEAWAARVAALPVHVVLVNLADTKRRNDQVGFGAVDEDLATFERLLASAGAPHARVGGDEWLLASAGDPAPLVAALVAAYARVEARRVGWAVVAERAGETKEARETVVTKVRRAARYLGAVAPDRDAVLRTALELADEIVGLPVDTYLERTAVRTWPRVGWSCVEHTPCDYYCPFCRGTRFAWEDGGTGMYDASGRCATCEAAVDFRDAGGPA